MTTPAAWHPDPTGRHEQRYWDGSQWTEHVSDAGQVSSDPVDGGAPAQQSAAAATPTATDQPADWYPDPSGRHELRYHDGTTWTDHVSDAGQVTSDPMTAAPAATGAEPAASGPVDQPDTQQAPAEDAGKSADWYPDPSGRHELRYHDGTTWTDHVSDAGQVTSDPMAAEPASAEPASAEPEREPEPEPEAEPEAEPEPEATGRETVMLSGYVPGAGTDPQPADTPGAGGATGGSGAAGPEPATGQPANWLADPTGRHEFRYWDGSSWTDHVSDAGQVSSDPVDGSGSAPAAAAQQPVTGQGFTAQQPSYGQPQQAYPQQAGGFPQAGQSPPASSATNGAAVAALIIGLLSLLIGWIPFIGLIAVVGGLIALILGFIGRGKVKKQQASGKGMATTGIVTGILAILLGIASTLIPVLFFSSFVEEMEEFTACVDAGGSEEQCFEEHAPGWMQRLVDVDDLNLGIDVGSNN